MYFNGAHECICGELRSSCVRYLVFLAWALNEIRRTTQYARHAIATKRVETKIFVLERWSVCVGRVVANDAFFHEYDFYQWRRSSDPAYHSERRNDKNVYCSCSHSRMKLKADNDENSVWAKCELSWRVLKHCVPLTMRNQLQKWLQCKCLTSTHDKHLKWIACGPQSVSRTQ